MIATAITQMSSAIEQVAQNAQVTSDKATATFSPQSCTLAIAFEEEKIFLKSQDEPITRILFYPAMKVSLVK